MKNSFPSPPLEWSSVSLGPLTVHMYAIMILIGIFVALWLTTRRWVERGGNADTVGEIAIWAIPFGIIGGRIYHVVSSPAAYFGEGGNPWAAFEIWNGGLGIWGAVAFGALGAYIGARRHGASFSAFIDAAAPAVLIAQAIGRLGNYFNQEVFGSPTTLPWALQIDASKRPEDYIQFETFHPTFLYELLWNLAGAALLIYLDRKWDLRGGRVFWLYVMVYTSGRLWIEMVRIDDAVHIGGLRVNVWVSILVFVGALIAFVVLGRKQARETNRVPRSQLAAPHHADVTDEPGDPSADVAPGVVLTEDNTDSMADAEATAEANPAAPDEPGAKA